MLFVTNSLSVNMFPVDDSILFRAYRIDKDKARRILSSEKRWISRVARKDLAIFIASELLVDIEANKKPVRLREGDSMLVCQFVGPKTYNTGVLELPDDARVEYWILEALR